MSIHTPDGDHHHGPAHRGAHFAVTVAVIAFLFLVVAGYAGVK